MDDLPRARRFYGAALDWRMGVDVPAYVELESEEGLRLGLYERGGFARNTAEAPDMGAAGRLRPTEIYLQGSADDARACIQRLEAAGARRLSPLAPRDWGDEVAYYADPEGNVIAVAHPAAAS